MPKIMIQFQCDGIKPTLEEVAKRFDIAPSLIDSEFDVIETDPEAGLCTILVDEEVSKQILEQLGEQQEEIEHKVEGFSNPLIEPFGPPEK